MVLFVMCWRTSYVLILVAMLVLAAMRLLIAVLILIAVRWSWLHALALPSVGSLLASMLVICI